MKIYTILYVLLTSLTFNSCGQNQPSSALELLKEIETKNKQVETLHYKSSYTNIYSGKQDSLYKVSAEVWLRKSAPDTIFGSVFHIKGIDDNENYDYFYDGQCTYEVRHSAKKVLIINPFSFPNDANNPAKARTALLPVLGYLTNVNLAKTLFTGNPEQKLTSTGKNWVIELKYPKDSYGMLKTRWITVNKDMVIINYKELVLWNGLHIITAYNITDYSVNKPFIATQIPLCEPFNTYTIKHYKNYKETNANSLIGRVAPSFDYTSFNGENIELNDFKGQYVLLDFWESWCGNCILALPELNKLNKSYGDNLTIIGITTVNRSEIRHLIETNHLCYINLLADNTIINNYKVTPRPTYILINPAGIIIQYSSNFGTIHSAIKLLDIK
ncbi:MAG: TlpA family protein disulfide reductase [Chitinophagaceae bacterium]